MERRENPLAFRFRYSLALIDYLQNGTPIELANHDVNRRSSVVASVIQQVADQARQQAPLAHHRQGLTLAGVVRSVNILPPRAQAGRCFPPSVAFGLHRAGW